MSNSCSTCIYFDPDGDSSRSGDCRRYPPYVLLNEDYNPRPFRPRLLASDWCGEFRASADVEEGTQ